MTKKVLYIVFYVIIAAGLIFLAGFAADRSLVMPCTDPQISIVSRSGNYFIKTHTVEQMLARHLREADGELINPDRLRRVHAVVNNIPYVEHANVFRANTGKLGVEVVLRDPIIRVINRNNESYYIDQNGYLFPLSETHTARVMLATGYITTAYTPGVNIADHYPEMHALYNLYELASYINGDDFWKAFIDHIYVLPDGKFELTPKNGAHIIEFGNARQVEDKFSKLMQFYLYGLTQKGWHYYRRINLEYRNQIICSK